MITKKAINENGNTEKVSVGNLENKSIESKTIEIDAQDIETTEANTASNNKSVTNDENTYIVKSPIVGTFYEGASPDTPPFVKVGDKVEKGQTLCIVEAMKIMNEIECEVSGEVVEILAHDEDIVEYGQPLIRIRR
jgi:acetyl-CoA carboxylase biotin carboxyl carrier protein